MADTHELIAAWNDYLATVDSWERLITGVAAIPGGCGLIYELPNPIDRPNESFAIADMRQLALSEPHKHSNGETEIYFVIQGVGKIAVGDNIQELKQGSVVVTPPDTMHLTLPVHDLVLAVVNTPPFEAENYVALRQTDPVVVEALAKLTA